MQIDQAKVGQRFLIRRYDTITSEVEEIELLGFSTNLSYFKCRSVKDDSIKWYCVNEVVVEDEVPVQ